jgi:hypothetical protein
MIEASMLATDQQGDELNAAAECSKTGCERLDTGDRMSDEIAIQQIINTYTDGASCRDWDQVLSTFAPGGTWEIPSMKACYEDPVVIRQVMAAFVGRMAYFVQINSPAVISVQGDEATARSMIRECGKFADRDEALEILGRYEDELIRTDKGWRFKRRAFHAFGQHRFPLLPVA